MVADERLDASPGFFHGITCFFGGLGLLLRTPSLWAISLVPVALFLGGWLLFGGLGVAYLPGLVGAAVGPTDSVVGGLGLGLLKVISGVLALGLGALVALVVAQPLSGPALASLVRSQERRLGAPARPETPFFRDMIQSVQSVLIGLAIGVPAMLFLAVIGFIFPPTLIVVAPLELLIATVALAWDVCDLPMSIRGLPVKTRIRWLRSHQAAVLGFGFSCALVQMIPVLNLLLLPAALLGSTRLVWDIEQRELQIGAGSALS